MIGQISPNILAIKRINFACVDWILAKIRGVRREKGISQEQIADLIGIDQKTYGNWETGRTEMTLTNLERIAKALEVPVTFFWDAKNYDPKQADPGKVNEPDPDLYKDLLSTKDKLINEQKERIKLLQEKLSKYETEN
jgi:transcriptional regulator with XRE-family HTH domain